MIALLFPGQGAQRPGVLRDVAALPHGCETIDEAAALLDEDLRAADDSATPPTDAVQRTLFVAGVACARALEAAGVVPDAVAGHSIGAFAAAVAAGALSFADALRLVDLRGRAMAAAYPQGYAMGAVTGLVPSVVRALVAQHATRHTTLYAANVNARDQMTVAGTRESVRNFLEAATRCGARATRMLDIDVPSHTPLMHAVEEQLERAFDDVAPVGARMWYACNRDGRLVRDALAIRRDLTSGVAYPVVWDDATHALYERGIRLFVETLPGTTLTELATAAFPEARAVALERTSLASVAALATHRQS